MERKNVLHRFMKKKGKLTKKSTEDQDDGSFKRMSIIAFLNAEIKKVVDSKISND